MDTRKRTKLEAGGWRIGSTKEFLGLSEQESTYIALKLAFSKNLKKRRQEKPMTQVELASLLKLIRNTVGFETIPTA